MGKWGKKLREHIRNSSTPADLYVDYKLFKKAVRACNEEDFRTLYVAEVIRFLANLEEGVRGDPDFAAVNLKTISNSAKKFEKFHSSTYNERVRLGAIGRFLYDETDQTQQIEWERKFVKALLQAAEPIKYRIYANEDYARRVFDELTRDKEGVSDCNDEEKDSEKSQKILSHEKLTTSLKRLGLPSSTEMVKQLIRACDVNGDGKIAWREFKTFMAARENQVRLAFMRLDPEGNGIIESGQIVDGLKLLGVAEPSVLAKRLIDASKIRRRRVSSEWWLTEAGISNAASDRSDDSDDDCMDGIDYTTFREMVLLLPAVHEEKSVLKYWQETADADPNFDMFFPPPTLQQKEGKSNIRSKSSSSLITLIAGGVAGAVSRSCTAPFDRLKMLMQVDPTFQNLGIYKGLKRIYSVGRTHRVGWLEGEFQYGKARGWRGYLAGSMAYFRGNGTNVTKIMPETAIKFWAYETCRDFVTRNEGGDIGHSDRFICGAVAGITAQTLIYPLEVTKTRMAVSRVGTYSGISHCLFKISRQEGIYALYRGLGASIVGIVPFSGVDMGVYFYLREKVVPKLLEDREDSTGLLEVSTMLTCGCLSSTCGMLVAYPLHLTRTRLQAQGLNGMRKYGGILDCIRSTIKRDGMRGLYRGFSANLLKAIPSISISYAIFESTKTKLLGI